METQVRVGIGYDVHRLVSDRPLVLGGIQIEYERGLLGYSDGDAVLHAVVDALLGAAGMGDIGELFPDNDPQYKDSDSKVLVRDVVSRLASNGYRPVNIDLVIHAERPNLTKYKQAMAESIGNLLGISVETGNVKAKTNEGLGPVGRREGIACTACVLLTVA